MECTFFFILIFFFAQAPSTLPSSVLFIVVYLLLQAQTAQFDCIHNFRCVCVCVCVCGYTYRCLSFHQSVNSSVFLPLSLHNFPSFSPISYLLLPYLKHPCTAPQVKPILSLETSGGAVLSADWSPQRPGVFACGTAEGVVSVCDLMVW